MHLTVGSHRSAPREREAGRSVRERGRGAGCCLRLSGAGLLNWAKGEEESIDAALGSGSGKQSWPGHAEEQRQAEGKEVSR